MKPIAKPLAFERVSLADAKRVHHEKPVAFERVTLSDAKRVYDGKPAVATLDWSIRRKTVNDKESLRPATLQWIDGLPAGERPLHLAKSYARIANKLGDLWGQPERCRHYLAELLIVRRNSRQGFPVDVVKEISNLTAHYAVLHPAGRPWT